ncbi:MAG: GNAT family N-acetyltransferase [Leptolyngbyaceae cyanobacterium RU_5_1]|nr:GNAT family N-acetyltransferase [Leptolyngbyaceae cyanobacterium RU_5_1]
MTATIKTVTVSDEANVVAMEVLAFSTDPMMRWMYPEPHQYLTYFPQFVRTFGGKAFEHNTADYIDGYIGAALWFPPGVEPDVEPLIALFQQSVADQNQADLFPILEQMGHYHPTQPHWYLSILGVEPIQQGKGYGSALMQHVLTQCDRTHMPAYLESSKPSNIPFYERHGFELLGTIQAGTSPPLFPMFRHPN